MRYTFDDLVLDTDRYELKRAGEAVHVEPQVFDVLTHLIENRDRVVTKHELLDAIWGDRFVSEAALTSRIRAVRQAVGDDGSAQRVIRTAHGRGYQFVAPVVAEGADRVRALALPHDQLHQEIRFCFSTDGVRLAYATVGSGTPLVRAAHWLTHLDFDWQSPVWHHWLVALAKDRRFIRYDERGCGLSDHDVDDFSLEAWVRDLEAVVDELALERFPLLGVSQGGPVAISYAARHPDRVSHLILVNTYSQGRWSRPQTDDEISETRLEHELVRLGWGRDDPKFRRFFTSSVIPDASAEMWEDFAELLRRTTSPENAIRLMETWRHLDVSDEVTAIDTPTLIMHSRDELRVPFEEGVKLATLIPGSRLIPLDSRNHLLTADEPAWPVFLGHLEDFLAEEEPR
jgi:pimeloyl-ACP methyl ester carboxylesterase/DNA-binding winged helix-turn-helix (wHTH) protein